MTAATKRKPAVKAAVPPAPALVLYQIRCEGGCGVTYQGHGSWELSWRAAYDEAGFRTDLSGVRRCGACVAERHPSLSLYLPAARMSRYLAARVPADGFLDGPPPAEADAWPLPSSRPPATAHYLASLLPEPVTVTVPAFTPELDEHAEAAVTTFLEAHDAEPVVPDPVMEPDDDAPHTAVIEIPEQLTETFKRVEDEGDAA